MYQAAQLAVREEPGSSPFRASALAYLGLATLIRGDDEAADALFAEASEVGERMGGMNAASLAFAERSLIATSRGDRDAADGYARLARAVVDDAHLDEHITTGPVYAASARAALRAGDEDQARVEVLDGRAACGPRNVSGPSSRGGSPPSRSRPGSSSRGSTSASPTSPAPAPS